MYQTTTTEQCAYLGLTETEPKQQYYNHKKLFRNGRYKSRTALSSYLCKFKSKTVKTAKVIWSVLKIVLRYLSLLKRYVLFSHGKLYISTYHDQEQLLIKRSELISKRFLAKNLLSANFKVIN